MDNLRYLSEKLKILNIIINKGTHIFFKKLYIILVHYYLYLLMRLPRSQIDYIAYLAYIEGM